MSITNAALLKTVQCKSDLKIDQSIKTREFLKASIFADIALERKDLPSTTYFRCVEGTGSFLTPKHIF